MIYLENEYLKAEISSKGAELQRLSRKDLSQEYIWSGDPQYWGKFSPVLFPIVGALKENMYRYQGNSYHLSRHGFARDREFEVMQTSETSVRFTLIQDDETLKVYPFEFVLSVIYELTEHTISCTYSVHNPAENALYFSVGGHPAFAVETDENLSYEDYFLHFNKDTEIRFHKISADLISNETRTIQLSDQKLPLSHQLFYEDALVIKTLKSDQITLGNRKNGRGLNFNFTGFPFFGIWAARDADFVCLEPWSGIADGVNHNQNLMDKEGINCLPSAQTWEKTWSVSCF